MWQKRYFDTDMFIGKLSLLEETADSFLHMQLVDLARTFTARQELEVEPAYHSLYNEAAGMLTISQFWSDLKPQQREAGMKSDVYLRAIGSAWYSGAADIAAYLKAIQTNPLARLGVQLFALCEDIRLEAICRRVRPGTSRVFAVRRQAYSSYFGHKLQSHLNQSETAEALFVLIYRWFSGEDGYVMAGLGEQAERLVHVLQGLLTSLYPLLEQVEFCETSEAAANLCLHMLEFLSYHLEQDAKTIYFSTEPANGTAEPLPSQLMPQLKRVKRLANDDTLTDEREESQPSRQERMPMWHRETSDRSPGLLRFDLERGSRTAAAGEALREGDAADQALAVVQGRSQRSERKNSADGPRQRRVVSGPGDLQAGAAAAAVNATATATFLPPVRPTAQQEDAYRRLAAGVAPLAKQLRRTIRQVLEHKRTAPQGDRLQGRLGRRLVRAVTEEAPRLFYKKRSPDPQLDVAFTLLVDCSASMYDKMDETKLGLTLFHETLKSLRIPHEVVGFWEDADRVTEEEAPNLFQVAVDFASSCGPSSGAALLQLEPQQDNRDGFAIRSMASRLLRRPERQRVLLVFSDGEPSAANYNEAGILDTYEAVLQARRMGLEVISVFLANGTVHDTQRQTMRNLYGRYSIVVPQVEELPQQLAPLLRKLLLKSIF
jgi:nitric oxide reductase activation protein